MHKAALPLLFSISFALILAQPAQALSILIDSNGDMSFQAGQVLGKDTESESEKENEVEHDGVEKETEYTEQESEKPKPENKSREKAPETRWELKNVSAREGKQLKIKNTREKTEILIERKAKPTPELKELEEGGTDKIDISLPVNQKSEVKNRPENEQKEINEAIQKIKRERRERRDTLEIKSKANDDGSNEFEIESGAIKAKLKSSEFVVDPATNEVRITTAEGVTHALIHLPDQALEQMVSADKLKNTDSISQSELTLETNEKGELLYKTKVKNQRKIMGFIPFSYESEIELNDANSQISTRPIDTSFLNKLLLSLSR